MKPSTRRSLASALLWLLPFLLLIVALLFYSAHFHQRITSDEASEMLLGKQLAEENSVLSPNWYYSTEIRVLNTNLFYSLFFRFTDDWHTVRTLTYAAEYLLLLGSLFLVGAATKNRAFMALLAAACFLPFSEEFQFSLLQGIYYIPCAVISFFVLAMAEWYSSSEKAVKRRLLLAVSCLVSVLAGMGGIRQLVVLYAPLLIAAFAALFTDKAAHRRWTFFSAAVFLGSALGYLLNATVLKRYYHFLSWNSLQFALPSADRLGTILSGFLSALGFSEEGVLSFALVRNILCFLLLGLVVYAVVYAFRHRETVSPAFFRLALLTVAAVAVFVLLYLFTDMFYHPRYGVPVLVLVFPLLALFFRDVGWKKTVSFSVLAVLVGGLLLSGAWYYKKTDDLDVNADKRDAIEFCLEEGYLNGYASFWNANVVTELSGGKIEMWNWGDFEKNTLDTLQGIDQFHRWLQTASHETEKPRGKVFMLLTWKEYRHNPWNADRMAEKEVYSNESYIVLGFESYEEAWEYTEDS